MFDDRININPDGSIEPSARDKERLTQDPPFGLTWAEWDNKAQDERKILQDAWDRIPVLKCKL